MTVRPVRGASLGVAGALVAGLVIAPMATTSAAVGDNDPNFYSVDAASASAGASATSARQASATSTTSRIALAKGAKVAKNVQILQRYAGTNSVGDQGLSIAAGPKHVMQIGSDRSRVLNKRTGAVVNTNQLGQLFNLSGFTSVTQGTVVYDPLARRWFIAAVTDDGGDIGLALRVSKGTKPTTWQPAVTFASDATGDPNSDAEESRPALGTSSDKVVITTLQNDPGTPANVNRIFFFPKSPVMSGNAPSPWVADLDSTYDGQYPAVNASSESNIFVAVPDTDDATATVYTGAATSSEPNFSKNVVYPTRGDMTAPPLINQGPDDDLDLGPLQFSGASWRNGELFAAASGDCGASGACVRLIGIGTEAGVTLIEDEKITNPLVGNEVFSPSVAIDGNGFVHIAATTVESGTGGPSLAAMILTKTALAGQSAQAAGDLKVRFVQQATDTFNDNGGDGTVDWYNSTGAAVDPTSPWDTWVTGAIGSSTVVNPNLETSIARISMARFKAKITASSSRVNKGSKVTLKLKVTRPQSKDTIQGLPVNLQRRPANGGSWSKVGSGVTNAKGVYKKKLTVKRASQYRGVVRKVQQTGGEGVVYDRVNSSPVTVRLS